MPFCSKCGTEVPENVQFCSKCEQTGQVSNPAPVANTGIENLSLLGYFFKCFKNFTFIKGRARRKEFWGFVLFSSIFKLIICLVLGIVYVLLDIDEETFDGLFNYVLAAWGVIITIPLFAVGIRRLNDVNASGEIIKGLYVLAVLSLNDSFLMNLLKPGEPIPKEIYLVAGLVSFVLSLFWLCRDGVPEENQHGKNPKYGNALQPQRILENLIASGQEILENIAENSLTDDEVKSALSSWRVIVGCLVGSFALMYFAGLKLAWGLKASFGGRLKEMDQWFLNLIGIKNYIIGEDSLLTEVNNGYYGLLITDRFFDFPIISWCLGGLGFFLLCAGILNLFYYILFRILLRIDKKI